MYVRLKLIYSGIWLHDRRTFGNFSGIMRSLVRNLALSDGDAEIYLRMGPAGPYPVAGTLLMHGLSSARQP